MPNYKIANVIFRADIHNEELLSFMKDYEYSGEEPYEVQFFVTKEDCERERSLSTGGGPNWYFNSLSLLRKFLDYLLDKDGFVLHSSAVAVDNKAYLFTAKSGTGKSTHVRLYKKLFGDKATVINDDKPIIRLIDGKFFAFGSPWSGKDDLNHNMCCEIQGICKLERAKDNSIERLDKKEIVALLLNQTVRFSEKDKIEKSLALLGTLSEKVRFYRLKCNMDVSAASVSFKAVSEGLYYED